MEDDVEAFVPATVQGRYNGKIEYKTQKGEVKYRAEKGYQNIPLNLVSLSKQVDDLVLLDDMNIPLIVHTIKERCKKDQIYVRFRLYCLLFPNVLFCFFINSLRCCLLTLSSG